MRTYRVNRKNELKYISDALIKAGIKIKKEPHPSVAPLIFEVLLPDGSEYTLICYAFHANQYLQNARPSDEHRFQVKYGSDFKTYHRLYIPHKNKSEITLMFGIHFGRNLIVAADPAMHEITRFSKSIEFKEENVLEVEKKGWAGWERQRIARGRRLMPLEEENLQDEVLLGFKPEKMLAYIQFEAIASGLDSGLRLQIIDHIGRGERPFEAARRILGTDRSKNSLTSLEKEMGLDFSEIADEVSNAFRLKVALRGSIAERHLAKQIEKITGIEEISRIDKDGHPDISVNFRGDNYFIECKNVLRKLPKSGLPKVDFQKTRASKNNPCSRYYASGQFDILAACLEPVSEEWSFKFRPVKDLSPHPKCPGRLDNKVFVNENWSIFLEEVFLDIKASRGNKG